MKANIHTATFLKGKGPFHGHDIRLTIALIVKNEEKTLDQCLSSLKPLLDAVPSELIITDTGSTDGTVEIAKKYTDHIINFEWCNDFSAARNTGLNAARGEWFLFLDGDEWFDDITGIVDFFRSGECDRYGSAAYVQRNYMDFEGKRYNDYRVCRIFRMYQGIHFNNKIHEDITRAEPTKIIDSFVHHYGYVYHDAEEREKKYNRNLDILLEEVKNDPDSLKMRVQLIGQYMDLKNYAKAAEECKEALNLEKEQKDLMLKLSIMQSLLKANFLQHDYQTVMDDLEDFLASEKYRGIFHLDYYRMAQLSALAIKNYQKALDYGHAYLQLCGKLEKHSNQEERLYFSFEYTGSQVKQDVLLTMGWSYLALGKPDEAVQIAESVQAAQIQPFSSLAKLYFALAEQKNDWSLVGILFQRLLNFNQPNLKMAFIDFVESYLQKNPDEMAKLSDSLSQLENNDDYVFLNQLRSAELTGDRKAAVASLEWFAQNPKERSYYYSDVLYFAMCEKINIMPLLRQTDTDDLPSISVNMQRQHSDFADVVSGYFDSYSFENVKGLYWSVCLLECAVLTKDAEKNSEQYLKLFESYTSNLARYVHSVYKAEMFTASNLAALPRVCRFGYYAGEALNARDKADMVGYIAGLRAALKEYPIMERPISLIAEHFEKEQKALDAKAREFASLARQVKEKITSLIEQGDMEQAGRLTAQISKLMPEDDDVLRFQKLTHTEPTMAELASRLPQ